MIEIECATIRRIANDIILLESKEDFDVELHDAVEINASYEQLANNQPIYSILNSAQSFNNFSKEAQYYLAKKAPFVEKKLLAGSAIVVTNLPNRLLAKFFINFYQPTYPIKIVATVDEALTWIEILRKKQLDVSS